MRLCSISVYETASHFYIIGSDASESKFSVLKVDRTAERDFVVGEPDHEYSKADVAELLSTISSSSIVTQSDTYYSARSSGHNTLVQTINKAYGLIGAIRFLEGYYLLIVTKARVVSTLGHHAIYKIEDVSMIYIPGSGASTNQDEQRYAKLFQSVDLTTNFYFSYTYNLSHTLQENTLAMKNLTWNKNSYAKNRPPDGKFVWNNFLLQPFRENGVSEKWTFEIVHGYIGQQIVELPCTKLAMILLARRSSIYAGTRFLKRGTNFQGAVANDVETEQIIWDMYSSPRFDTGKFTSFVQRRGSIPLFWSQDPATRTVVGKPPIFVDLVEPNALTTAAHFRELRRKYGYPIVAISLVKQKEKRPHERLLHEQFLKTVRYLNNFMKTGKCIDFISFDVARCNKKGQVLNKLEQIGFRCILKHGWFQSFPVLKSREIHKSDLLSSYQPYYSSDGTMILQNGASRTNCIDCLDRTNVAQFGIALGCQLYAMGYTDEPVITSSSELCRIYEELFDEHGDTLAWQYAGSQLVHSIKTYKKIAAFQERSRDVIQTISRYYSNTFSDYEKQNSINLFLGLYRPHLHGRPHIWELNSDRYIHFPVSDQPKNNHLKWVQNVNSDSEDDLDEEWFKISLKDMLEEMEDAGPPQISMSPRKKSVSVVPDHEELYNLAHRTFELTSFDQLLKEVAHNRKMVSINEVNQTAFQSTSFMKLWKTPETVAEKRTVKYVEQKPIPSEDDDEDDDEDAPTTDDDLNFDEDLNIVSSMKNEHPSSTIKLNEPLSVSTGLKTMEQAYGFEFKPLSNEDREKFERYVQLSNAKLPEGTDFRDPSSIRNLIKLTPIFEFKEPNFKSDSSFQTEIPEVDEKSLQMYREMASKKTFEPSWESLKVYQEYGRR